MNSLLVLLRPSPFLVLLGLLLVSLAPASAAVSQARSGVSVALRNTKLHALPNLLPRGRGPSLQASFSSAPSTLSSSSLLSPLPPAPFGIAASPRLVAGRDVAVHAGATEKIERFASKNFDLPRESVIRAVEERGGRATASDVAAAAGVTISEATRELNRLTSIAEGALEVSEGGDIVYDVGGNVRGSLAMRSTGLRAREAFRAIAPVLMYLVKLGFGVAIFASIAVIFTAIGVISASGSSDDRRRRDDRGFGGSYGGGFGGPNVFINLGPSPFDIFYYRPYGYYAPYGRGDEMGVLESIFSYVFGDGDPNAKRKQRSLRAAARVIRDNLGVVTAEQLAPVLAPETAPKEAGERGLDDEAFMLDVLVALNGQPEVTADGDIVYVFPDLTITAEVAEAGGYDEDRDDDGVRYYGKAAILPEEEIPFSLAPGGKKVLAGALGIVNLVGALYLGVLLRDPYLIYKVGPGFAFAIKGLFPYLLTYAVGFNAIPFFRNLANRAKNADIEARNYFRTLWASQQSKAGVQRKIKEARRYRPQSRKLTQDKAIYSTAKDLDEQERFRNPDKEKMKAFDQQLIDKQPQPQPGRGARVPEKRRDRTY